ncbi:MAG TPA: polysaccharide deacetylase family protein [Ramlibacter sp.]|nr:polysaccharide deacetylase family protein [Ramlibacter sp.]HZY19966.1 polysaccharide deacetylase family protein [Ramlibacter sp.]
MIPTTVQARPGRWPLPPLLQASAAVHLGAAGAFLASPGLWPHAAGAVALNHLLLAATGLWPRSTALGDNLLRLPPEAVQRGEVGLTIDDGPDPQVTPRVLDLLDAAGARATFFCIGARARRHPDLVREIVRRGHSVQNHSLVHRHHFSLLGPGPMRREIVRAQEALAQAAGQAPTLFRAPAGLRNPFLAPVLHGLGLRLVSWTRRGFDTRERDPVRVLQRLTRGLAAGDILLLHDGNAACTAQGEPVTLAVLPTLLADIQRRGLRCVTLPQALRAS